VLVILVAAKEDCFQKPFKTIEAVRVPKFIWQPLFCIPTFFVLISQDRPANAVSSRHNHLTSTAIFPRRQLSRCRR